MEVIRAEIWAEYHEDLWDCCNEVESKTIICSSVAEVEEELEKMVVHLLNNYYVDDSGYEIIDREIRR